MDVKPVEEELVLVLRTKDNSKRSMLQDYQQQRSLQAHHRMLEHEELLREQDNFKRKIGVCTVYFVCTQVLLLLVGRTVE